MRGLHKLMCDTLHVREVVVMATNLAIDDRLIEEARRVGGHSTKRQAVTVALEEYVAHRKQLAILDLFGTVDFDTKYDYRRSRKLDRVGRDR
jgi:Arc/MetJ family transcription regulator